MYTSFKEEIARQISALSGVQTDKVLEAIAPPRLAEHGDFAVAIPRLRLPGNPAANATDLANRMEKNELLTAISCQGPFINIFINKQRLMQLTLKQVFEARETFGQNKSGEGK
ncbi:Arginyl tRNA synthetase, partial [Ramicandelaber brevisporus]